MEDFSKQKDISVVENKEYISLWKKLASKNLYRMLFGGIVGAGLGALYWNFIGCSGGSCPLTSDPYKTIIIFSFMGAMFTRKNKSDNA